MVSNAPLFQMEVAVAGVAVLRKRGIGLLAAKGQQLKLKKVACTERFASGFAISNITCCGWSTCSAISRSLFASSYTSHVVL